MKDGSACRVEDPEERIENGFAWSVDGSGVLAVRKTDDGDGVIRMNPVTETVSVQVGYKDEGCWEDRERILYYERPWQQYADRITEARIGEGIMGLSDAALSGLKNMKHVRLPSTLKATV